MVSWRTILGVAGVCALVLVLFWTHERGRPQEGETVTPHLEWPLTWTAGASGRLGVRLSAKPEGGRARLLDFGALPSSVNPVAAIAFFRDTQPVGSLEVALSHRC